jgi:hypothetical protein
MPEQAFLVPGIAIFKIAKTEKQDNLKMETVSQRNLGNWKKAF